MMQGQCCASRRETPPEVLMSLRTYSGTQASEKRRGIS